MSYFNFKSLSLRALVICIMISPLYADETCLPLTLAFREGWLKAEKFEPRVIPILHQNKVAENSAISYPLTIPGKISDRFLHSIKMGDYQFLESNPASFNVFKTNSARNIPEISHSLAFTNAGSEYKEVVKTSFGMCMGQTSAQRKFNILSFFDPENKMLQKIPDKEKDLEGWYRFYENKISEILVSNNPTSIPGFKDLNSFSSEPRLKQHIQKIIVDIWAKKNISMSGLKMLHGVTEQTDLRAAKNLHKLVSDRLSKNYSPALFLAEMNTSMFKKEQWIHVMQAYKVDPINPDGSYIIYLWDVNGSGKGASARLFVDGKGGMKYGGRHMGKVAQVPWDDQEIGEMGVKMLEFCEKNPTLCNPN